MEKFHRIVKSIMCEQFISNGWGELVLAGKSKKWLFCPLATAALRLGLSRRKLIAALKEDEAAETDCYAPRLIYLHMNKSGFPAANQILFLNTWDHLTATRIDLSVKKRLKFSAWMADNADEFPKLCSLIKFQDLVDTMLEKWL